MSKKRTSFAGFVFAHRQALTAAVVGHQGTGQVIGIEHHWQFDEAYSAFAVQGLDTNKDGTISREELAALAKENTESLSEFDFFTKLKVDGKTGVVEVVSRAPPLPPPLLPPPLLLHSGRVSKNTQSAPSPTPFAFRRNAPGRVRSGAGAR